MRNVVFVAPFPLDTTMRFARAAAALGDVRFLGIMQETPRGDDQSLFADLVTVRDGLDTRQLIEAAQLLRHRHGDIHRVRCMVCSASFEFLEEYVAMFREGEAPPCPACADRGEPAIPSGGAVPYGD